MITVLLCITAAIWIAELAVLVVSMRRAPRGSEDAEGFHEELETARSTTPVHGVTAHLH